jgi:iron(III) transport system ATP-binding protein
MRISLEALSKSYGAVRAIDEVDLEVSDGEILVLLGPSGCGKTTTMRSIVGLEIPDSGRITVGDNVVFDGTAGTNVATNRRRMGMVFQSYAIWPHKTVFENVSYPLEQQRVAKAEIRERVRKVLDLVGLTTFADRGASLLSGGQMQRVALARSIVAEPRVLLLDEPLSNLDAKLRDHLRFELRQIQQRLGFTAIYVTHDQTEAMALADRIAVMNEGRIVQLGTPWHIYQQPANRFVADFLGVSNIFPCTIESRNDDGTTNVRLLKGDVRLKAASPADATGEMYVCIRPEHIRLADGEPARNGPSGAAAIEARVEAVNYLGSQIRYLLSCRPEVMFAAISYDTETIRKAGALVQISFDSRNAQLLAN